MPILEDGHTTTESVEEFGQIREEVSQPYTDLTGGTSSTEDSAWGGFIYVVSGQAEDALPRPISKDKPSVRGETEVDRGARHGYNSS